MTSRANFQKSYLLRYLLFILVTLPMGLYFYYDGTIGYPTQMKYAEAYEALEDLPAKEKRAKWKEITSEKGWPSREPTKKAKEIEEDITGQFVWGTVCCVIWLPALVYYLRSRGTWVERTATGITTSWGQSFNFDQVELLDKKKWASKGIAQCYYTENGQRKRFTFDDFKYDRAPLDRMLYELEQNLSPEKIVNGPPEPPPGTEDSESADEGDRQAVTTDAQGDPTDRDSSGDGVALKS